MTKFVSTLCAFLNTGGGYIVFGIDDESHEIVGICEQKSYDRFLLRIDNIYHNRQILRHDGSALPVGTIQVAFVKAGKGRMICVLTATRDPTYSYHMADGSYWFRLGASNYRRADTFTTYSQEQVDSLIQAVHTSYRGKMSIVQADLENLSRAAMRMENAADTIQELLFTRILQEKEAAEKALVQSRSLFAMLCCGA